MPCFQTIKNNIKSEKMTLKAIYKMLDKDIYNLSISLGSILSQHDPPLFPLYLIFRVKTQGICFFLFFLQKRKSVTVTLRLTITMMNTGVLGPCGPICNGFIYFLVPLLPLKAFP
jgi:hypothetical protein